MRSPMTVRPPSEEKEEIRNPSDTDPKVMPIAMVVLLFLASVSFIAPTIIGLTLSLQEGTQPWGLVKALVPVFFEVDQGPFAFIVKHWVAIPALVSGYFMARRTSRRHATLLTFFIMLIVAFFGSLALYLQPSDPMLRAIAAEMSGSLDQNLLNLKAVYEQVERTRSIAIPVFIALAGGAVAGKKVL